MQQSKARSSPMGPGDLAHGSRRPLPNSFAQRASPVKALKSLPTRRAPTCFREIANKEDFFRRWRAKTTDRLPPEAQELQTDFEKVHYAMSQRLRRSYTRPNPMCRALCFKLAQLKPSASYGTLDDVLKQHFSKSAVSVPRTSYAVQIWNRSGQEALLRYASIIPPGLPLVPDMLLAVENYIHDITDEIAELDRVGELERQQAQIQKQLASPMSRSPAATKSVTPRKETSATIRPQRSGISASRVSHSSTATTRQTNRLTAGSDATVSAAMPSDSGAIKRSPRAPPARLAPSGAQTATSSRGLMGRDGSVATQKSAASLLTKPFSAHDERQRSVDLPSKSSMTSPPLRGGSNLPKSPTSVVTGVRKSPSALQQNRQRPLSEMGSFTASPNSSRRGATSEGKALDSKKESASGTRKGRVEPLPRKPIKQSSLNQEAAETVLSEEAPLSTQRFSDKSNTQQTMASSKANASPHSYLLNPAPSKQSFSSESSPRTPQRRTEINKSAEKPSRSKKPAPVSSFDTGTSPRPLHSPDTHSIVSQLSETLRQESLARLQQATEGRGQPLL